MQFTMAYPYYFKGPDHLIQSPHKVGLPINTLFDNWVNNTLYDLEINNLIYLTCQNHRFW